jgi:hypothetical protein
MDGLDRERFVHLQATALAREGVRPTFIRSILRNGITLAEASRIFRIATNLSPTERSGRAIRTAALPSLASDGRIVLYTSMLIDAVEAVSAGCEVTDSLLAAWRVEMSRRTSNNIPVPIKARLEDLVILYQHFEAGEIEIHNCARGCGQRQIGLADLRVRSTCLHDCQAGALAGVRAHLTA